MAQALKTTHPIVGFSIGCSVRKRLHFASDGRHKDKSAAGPFRRALVEAERSYRILLEQSDDPDVAVNLGALPGAKAGFKKVVHIITVGWRDGRNSAT